MILDQLKMSIADPTHLEIAFSYITALSPAIKARNEAAYGRKVQNRNDCE